MEISNEKNFSLDTILWIFTFNFLSWGRPVPPFRDVLLLRLRDIVIFFSWFVIFEVILTYKRVAHFAGFTVNVWTSSGEEKGWNSKTNIEN